VTTNSTANLPTMHFVRLIPLLALSACGSSTPAVVLRQPAHNRLMVDAETIRFTFDDAAHMVGQPCTCAAAGFRIAQIGLRQLGEPMPARGELFLAASRDHAVSDVVAYLLGAARRVDPKRTAFVIDPSLSDSPDRWCFVVGDPEHRRAAQITFHKARLMPEPLRSHLRRVEQRAERGAASAADRRQFRAAMTKLVRQLFDPAASADLLDARTLPWTEVQRQYPELARHHD